LIFFNHGSSLSTFFFGHFLLQPPRIRKETWSFALLPGKRRKEMRIGNAPQGISKIFQDDLQAPSWPVQENSEMNIDINSDPPGDILERRKKYLRKILIFLFLVLCGVLLGAYRVLYDSGYDTLLENIALALFAGAGFIFVYFAEKFNDLKFLTHKQQDRILELSGQHQEIAVYISKVAGMGRPLVAAEYDAIIDHAKKEKENNR
jgi:hypothetical protein